MKKLEDEANLQHDFYNMCMQGILHGSWQYLKNQAFRGAQYNSRQSTSTFYNYDETETYEQALRRNIKVPEYLDKSTLKV